MGGDVPDTNYLFMGMKPLLPGFCRNDHRLEILADRISIQATLSTVVSTPSNLSSSFSASRSAIPIA